MRILAGLDGARIDGVRGTGLPAAREIAMGDAIVYFGHDRSRFEAVLPTGAPVATGLALRGAETTMVGLSEGRLVVWAPPRFDTLLALRYALLQPWVDARCGLRRRPVWRRAPLLRKLASVVGLAELALLREAPGGLEPLGLGSLTLAGIAQAEGYQIVPPGSEGAQAGQTVEAFAL
jgi:molybdopterin biosynthesis enzyme